MNYTEISQQPTSLDRPQIEEGLTRGVKGFHESLLRSYHIVNKIKWLLERKTSPEVISELIELMEAGREQSGD